MKGDAKWVKMGWLVWGNRWSLRVIEVALKSGYELLFAFHVNYMRVI